MDVLKTLSSSIPGTNQTPRSKNLRQADPLLLPSTDTSNVRISNLRIRDLLQAEDIEQNLDPMLLERLPLHPVESVAWRTGLGGEEQRLRYGKRGEMDVVLRAVLDVSAMVTSELFGSE